MVFIETIENDTSEAASLKECGNAHFKEGRFQAALQQYSQALKLHPTEGDKATLLKNRAAVYLKLDKFELAETDCTEALEVVSNDPKALFRRSQAREKLGKSGEAFQDAKAALHIEPANKAIYAAVERLAKEVQKQREEQSSTAFRVKQMFEIGFAKDTPRDKRLKAMNNLLVLARERAGAQLLWEAGAVEKLLELTQQQDMPQGQGDIDDEVEGDLTVAAQRVLDELARDGDRASSMLQKLGHRGVVRQLNTPNQRQQESVVLFIQRLFNALTGIDFSQADSKADEALCEKNKLDIVDLLFELKSMLIDPSVLASARNHVIDILLRNLMHMDRGLPRGWSWKFMQDEGVLRLVEVAANVPEQYTIPVNSDTRQHLAICLARLYDDCVFDKYREVYQKVLERWLSNELAKKSPESKVRIVAAATTLLLGPVDVALTLVTNFGITDLMLELAGSDNEIHQGVAVEAIVNAASKRDKVSAIVSQGVPILKRLYESKNDHIKARALVGLCKCAASGGSDSSIQPMAEGSTTQLAKACKKFLLNPGKNNDLRRWAAEGLSYLTLDADVKEWLVEDPAAIRALVELAKATGSLCVYAVASIFVNLTNTYEVPKADEEMVKLAKFAKHHVPEPHKKDAESFVLKRTEALVKEGAVSAAVSISNTDSEQCQELLARCLCGFARVESLRGYVVQEGGAKLLVKLAQAGTGEGMTHAAQGLAKIGLSMDPKIAFPGQRVYEVVKPLLSLLHVERSGLQNYEALLALTNVSSVDDTVRRRLVKERALPKIEEYWFMQDHEDLRAAAAELLLNLIHCKEAFELMVAPGSDRLKVWLLYAAEFEENERLALASSAGLVLLTEDKNACIRLSKEVVSFAEVVPEMCACYQPEIQYRAIRAANNLLRSDYEVAATLMQGELFEVLLAVAKMPKEENVPRRSQSAQLAQAVLDYAAQIELIQPTDRELAERAEKKKRNMLRQNDHNLHSVQEEAE